MKQTAKTPKPIDFKVEVDGVETDFVIKPETLDIQRKCDAEYSIAFVQAIKLGVPPRSSLEKMLKDHDMWSDKDDENLQTLRAAIANLEIKIAEANTTSEGLPLAVELGELRGKLVEVTQQRGEVLNNSAEFMAEQVRRDAYIAHATCYADTGKPVFRSYADFIENADGPIALEARAALARVLYKELGDYLDSLPEAAFRNVEAGLAGTEEPASPAKKKITRKKASTKK